jgi:plastocyanin
MNFKIKPMKKQLLLSAFVLSAFFCKGTIHVVVNSGFTFSPMSIQVLAGDTVNFLIDPSHNVQEVSQSTWISNMSTALPGGFSLPFGGGMLNTAGLSVATHYYVCQPHASSGMKGVIQVIGTVGIDEQDGYLSIATAPNPFEDRMEVHAPGIDEIAVYNMLGRQVQTIYLDASGSFVFDGGRLSRGMYFFRFIREQAIVETRRVIRR